MSKHVATATMEEIRKGGRSRKREGDEVKEKLNVMGIKNGQEMVRGRWE
jgi:hypothetical protein